MMTVVTGGSGSGKSAFAEDKIVSFGPGKRIYIATMHPYDEESHKRVARHRKMRAGKGFETVECYIGLKNLDLPENAVVLLECMSNLLANEIFSPAGSGKNAYEEIIKGVDFVLQNCKNLVVVTNDVFSDGVLYHEETMEYIKVLGEINYTLAKKADEVIDVVSSVPVYYKKGKKKC